MELIIPVNNLLARRRIKGDAATTAGRIRIGGLLEVLKILRFPYCIRTFDSCRLCQHSLSGRNRCRKEHKSKHKPLRTQGYLILLIMMMGQ